MKTIAGALLATVLTVPGFAAAQYANRPHESMGRTGLPMPSGIHDKYGSELSHGASAPAYPMHKPDGAHRHKVTAIFVYVPAIGSVSVPYYYGPSAPLYVDQDPPAGAYRDLSGLYYWCPDPPGYYPYQLDCPMGWRLVAP